MNTKTTFDKGGYTAPECTVIALGAENCVMQASGVTLSIIELSSNPLSTEDFITPSSENDLWF